MRLVAIALVLVLLSGCTLGGPQGAPEERAKRAWDDFAASMLGTGGSMSKLEGTLSSGTYGASLLFEIARDGARHAKLSVSGLGFEYYCKGDEAVKVDGDKALAMRAGECPLKGFGELSLTTLLNATRVANATAHGDEVTATIVSNNSTQAAQGGITIVVDRKDHVIHVEMTSPGGNVNANASYDRRGTWSLPQTTGRLPANVAGRDDFTRDGANGTFEWSADSAGGNYTLDDFEVRVRDPTANQTLATFPLARNGTKDGFAYAFEDRDGDGRLSKDDRFTLAKTGWTTRRQYEVQVWDTWADAPVARRVPGFEGALLLVGASVAFALLWLRSRKKKDG